MNLEKLLEQYATLAIYNGVNVQVNQLLVINATVDCADFVRKVVKKAYEKGASEVKVNWSDDIVSKLRYENASDEILSTIPEFKLQEIEYEQNQKCCYLSIRSPNPMIFKDVDPSKLHLEQKASGIAFKPFRNYTMSSIGQWSMLLLPNPTWAKLVYPNLEEEKAVEALYKQIFACSRVEEANDVAAAWQEHIQQLKRYQNILNTYAFKSLHFMNSLGTDLSVELVENHLWAGGSEATPEGIEFIPNIPTEECFSMPFKYGVNGTVYATKPLNVQGKLIEDFYFEFKNGKVINFDAKQNKESLQNLLDMDKGSRYLGEVALLSNDSPISASGLVFYNTLFDENASCHLALGNCYPMNIKDGEKMSQEELEAKGANFSMVHCDFMFGSNDMNVIGIKEDGEKVTVFENGNFVF